MMWSIVPLLVAFHLTASSFNASQIFNDSFPELSKKNEKYYNPIYTDALICAKDRDVDGKFYFEKCPRYASTGLMPFCVYMLIPSTSKTKGYDAYGCVYGHKLPSQCLAKTKAYLPHVTISIRGQNHTGMALCCMDNYCNEIEEPLFTLIRLKEGEKVGSNGPLLWPIVVACFLVVITIIPWAQVKLDERHQTSVRQLEEPGFLDESVGQDNPWQVTEVNDVWQQSMNFASLKQMQQTVKEVLQPMRHSHQSHSGTLGSTPRNKSLPTGSIMGGSPLLGDERTLEHSEFMINEHCKVFQRCDKQPHKAVRTVVSRYEHLAQRLIEHGPYRFDFDPVELGDLFDGVTNILSQEPSLLNLEPDIFIYGNLEGSYGDLFRWMHRNGWPPRHRVLFLGGLTSESDPYSLETIALIFSLKKLMPQHVYILRGASEAYPIRLEPNRFSRRVTDCLQDVINRLYAYLPLAATIGNVFCSHGGMPMKFKELAECASIKKPLPQIAEESLAAKLIFSQVATKDGPIPGCRGIGFSNNTRFDLQSSRTGQTFALYVRARNSCANGYMFIGDAVLNLWSATNAALENRSAAALYIDREMIASVMKMAPFGLYDKDELKKAGEQRKKRDNDKKKKKKGDKKKKKKSKIPKYPQEFTCNPPSNEVSSGPVKIS